MLTLTEEVSLQYSRINNACSSCGEPPTDGVAHKEVATVRFSAGSLVLTLCDRCASGQIERVRDQLISHEAASVFNARQSPEDINALSEELVRMNHWIAAHSAPGEPCDECGQPLVAGEAVSVADAPAVQSGISLGKCLFVLCPRCTKGKHQRIRSFCDRFTARLVSPRATTFIRDLINPKPVMQ